MIERVYYPYTQWEDWQNGMYKTLDNSKDEEYINKSIELLSNADKFLLSARDMINSWKIAAEYNLTNLSQNRIAWIGQASCCFVYGVPEYLTRLAWVKIPEEKQIKANEIAAIALREWEENYSNNQQLTFQF